MANLRVFVSSTCFDLSVVRGQLRSFLEYQGHLPVMSDYNDVLYDPRVHTHTSCVDEVAGCDVVVLIIGGRLGGRAIPQATSFVDFDRLNVESNSSEFLKNAKDISVTQLEVLKAIDKSIPVFAFVEERVWNDHATYEKNKTKTIADEIEYASIEKSSTAKYIFEFINYIRHRTSNNSLTPFSKYQEIEDNLSKQWSALLQRLLLEQRTKTVEVRRIDEFTEQLEDLKVAILSGMGAGDQKEIARGVIRYRGLFDFLIGMNAAKLKFPMTMYTQNPVEWKELLKRFDIRQVLELPREVGRDLNQFGPRITGFLITNEDTIYVLYFPIKADAISEEFNAFMQLPVATRKIIFETLAETRPRMSSRFVRYQETSLEEFLVDIQNPKEKEIYQESIPMVAVEKNIPDTVQKVKREPVSRSRKKQ